MLQQEKQGFYEKYGKEEEANKIYEHILNIDPNFMALVWMNEGISLHSESKYMVLRYFKWVD